MQRKDSFLQECSPCLWLQGANILNCWTKGPNGSQVLQGWGKCSVKLLYLLLQLLAPGHSQDGTWGWQVCPSRLTQKWLLPCGESQQVSSVEEACCGVLEARANSRNLSVAEARRCWEAKRQLVYCWRKFQNYVTVHFCYISLGFFAKMKQASGNPANLSSAETIKHS